MQRRNTSWLTYRERFVLSTVHSLVRTDAQSWYNPGEIDAVVDIVQSLTSELPDMRQKEIAVITPWREQVWKLRAKLRESGLAGWIPETSRSVADCAPCQTLTVQTYQGGEFRVTIISCVRSQERFLAEDKRTNMGLFNEAKRCVLYPAEHCI